MGSLCCATEVLSQAQINISTANPGQEANDDRVMWKVASADSDLAETPPCLDVWKIDPADSDPVGETTPYREVCSILNPADDHCRESTPSAENERILDANVPTGEASKREQVGNPVDTHCGG
jgi:hypothetical protein